MSNAFNAMDFDSNVGAQLKKIIEGRLDELRRQLEDPTMSDRDTQATRGAIQELRRMLRPAPPQVTTPRYGGMDFSQRGRETS